MKNRDITVKDIVKKLNDDGIDLTKLYASQTMTAITGVFRTAQTDLVAEINEKTAADLVQFMPLVNQATVGIRDKMVAEMK